MSADTVSPLFPDRPIRPLPKRRLRERLSPDVADSIQYPPGPQTTSPLFYYPYTRDEDTGSAPYGRRESRPGLQGPANKDEQSVSGDNDKERMSRIASMAINISDSMSKPSSTASAKQDQARNLPPPSAASSADGYYDPFEITNNKKKRKIPTAGDGMLSGTHAIHDNMGGPDSPGTPISSVEGHGDLASAAPSSSSYYNGQSTGNHNVSGPGRGRYGRVRNGRSPLRTLSDSFHNWAGRNGKLRSSLWGPPSAENPGIISTAIANAGKLPPAPGQENLSLLQQREQSAKIQPETTQFTFTCESQVPGSVAWPGADRRHTVAGPHIPSATRENGGRLSAPATYPATTTLPVRKMGTHLSKPVTALAGQATDSGTVQPAAPGAGPPPTPTPKEIGQEIRQTARQRRREQQSNNREDPEKAIAEFWMCQFCEYEAIFGTKPKALIRQFEIKDRRQRMEEAEKRRLREKARTMSRKGKKTNPKPGNSRAAIRDRTPPQVDQGAPPGPSADGGGMRLDEFDRGEEHYEEAENGADGSRAEDDHQGARRGDGVGPGFPATGAGASSGPPVWSVVTGSEILSTGAPVSSP